LATWSYRQRENCVPLNSRVGSPKSSTEVASPFCHFHTSLSLVPPALFFRRSRLLPAWSDWRQPESGAALQAGFGVGVYLCQYTSDALGVHDHSAIVWDEIVGYWITMTAVPLAWQWILLGFMLFRLFDIVKPWPVKLADKRMKGGFGIMFDDVLAGLYALAGMHLALWFAG